MIHGRSADEIDAYRAEIRRLLGDTCRLDDMLVSSRILKKTGLRVGAGASRAPAARTATRA
ncbi:hypothetical protein STUTZSP0542_25260 [Stutzerimonas marianensis]